MSTHDLTLISHPLCPFVQRSAIVLLEKNVPFERVNVDLTGLGTFSQSRNLSSNGNTSSFTHAAESRLMPEAPSYSRCQTVSVPHPSGLKTPQPVATIRL